MKIPPDLPLPAPGRKNIPKGGVTPLWPPAHRASGPEGKEGSGEIFATTSLLNYDEVVKSRKSLRVVIPVPIFIGINSSRPPAHRASGPEGIQQLQSVIKTLDTGSCRRTGETIFYENIILSLVPLPVSKGPALWIILS